MPSTQRAVQQSVRLYACLWAGLLAFVALLGCSQTSSRSQESSGGSPGRGIYVEADWSKDRRVTGHRVHVEEQRIACNACHELNATAMGTVSPSRCATCHAARATIGSTQRAWRSSASGTVCAARLCELPRLHQRYGSGAALQGGLDGGALEPYQPSECARCHPESTRANPSRHRARFHRLPELSSPPSGR